MSNGFNLSFELRDNNKVSKPYSANLEETIHPAVPPPITIKSARISDEDLIDLFSGS